MSTRRGDLVDETKDREPTTERSLGLGGAVLDGRALDDVLQSVVELARHAITGAHTVSITVTDGGAYRTSNSTDSGALAIDEAQYTAQDGPCLEGIKTARQQQAAIDAMDVRWPLVAEKARELGVAGVLSTPLLVDGGAAMGALNVYASETARFGEQELRTAGLISQHAAKLVANAVALLSATQLNDQLREAVASREIIGEAKGILMERESCSRDTAFDMLRRASQRENRKLRELAEELVARVESRTRERPSR